MYDAYSQSCLLLKTKIYSGILTFCSDMFSHIVAYLEPCVTLSYSELCHTQNPGIFRTQDMPRVLSRHIQVYAGRCVILAYWELCHIKKFSIFRILAHLGPEAYSICLKITLTFFFHEIYKGICFLTTMTSISMPEWIYLIIWDLWK